MKELLHEWFTYNQQMNDKFLSLAAELSAEQLTADHGYGHGSILKTLYHILTIETVWRQLAHQGELTVRFPPLDQLDSIEKLQAYHAEQTQLLNDQIEGFSEEDINETITATDWQGNLHQLKRWHMLTHLLNHSMQHRTEAAMWLTEAGRSPGDIDLIFFFMTH